MRYVFKQSYEADIRLFKHGSQAFWYALLLLGVLLLPFFVDEFYLGEAINVLIFAIAGMGLMMLTGQAGLASLGHAAFMAVGCYVNTILMMNGVPFLISLPLAALASAAIGVIVTLPVLRLHGIYLAIATLTLSILTQDIILIFEPWTNGATGLEAQPINIFGLDIDRYGTPDLFYYMVLSLVLIVLLAYRNIMRSPTGRAFTAVRDSEISAKAMGINLTKTKALAFGFSCFACGIAGALIGHYSYAFNDETFNIIMSIQLLLMIVIGGLGSIHGAFFGAIIIGFLPQFLSITRENIESLTGVSLNFPGMENAIFSMILMFILMVEPMGIYGIWFRIKTYLELFPFYRKNMFKRQKSYLKTERMR